MAKKNNTKYTEDSIISLDPREFCRLRPSTYLGSNEFSTQLVREVFANALDEHCIGHGDTISVSINTKENTYTVRDFGQGFIINSIRPDGKTILEAAFSVLNTSGKYDDTGGVYTGTSLGCNGIGSKLTNYLSTNLDVYSSDGKRYEHIWFKDGLFEKRETGKNEEPSGTIVTWTPDPQFFQNKEANIGDLKKLFEDMSALCPTLTISFIIDGVETIYKAPNGIQDLLNKKVNNKEIISSRFTIRKEADPELFDISITYTSDYSENIIAYVNYGLTESGIHISTLKANLVRQLNRYASEVGLLKKNDSAFTQGEISEGLFVVFNLKTTNVKYDSQTKNRIVDLNKTLINNVINNDFYSWLINNPKDAKIIIDKALTARKVREASQKAKDKIRNATVKGKKFINLPTKLIDAYSKDRQECSLFITEGDSAANGLVAKRDGKTQAVFPIRGKVLSCRKATTDKIYANQEIANIVKAIGLEVDKTTGKLIYDIKKLRYGLIVLAADSDADGFAIRSLLINMFWWLCPELIKNGHVAIAYAPLFRVTTKDNKYIYLNDQAELETYKKNNPKNDYILSRNKGLGESSPDELADAVLRPATRNVKIIKVTDEQKADNMLECFFGNNVESRRKFLLENYDATLSE